MNIYIQVYQKNVYMYSIGGINLINLIKEMQMKNIKYVCRIKKNTNIIDKNNEDMITKINIDNRTIKLRVTNYKINDTEYYIVSNLFNMNEYTIDKIKQFYHNRWDVEEYFK